MPSTAAGTFEISMTPGSDELRGAVSRLDFTKDWRGDLEGSGPAFCFRVVIHKPVRPATSPSRRSMGGWETARGALPSSSQGSCTPGSQSLRYEITPGSGRGALAGITGSLQLTIENDGTHRYELSYDL
jgi:hypothetical protein